MGFEKIFLPGNLTNLQEPTQLLILNDVLNQLISRINQIDFGSVALSWIEGFAAGSVIYSAGVGNAPVWEDEPTLTGLTLTGLTASQFVVTNGSKALASSNTQGVTNGDSHDHVGGDGAQINHTTLSNIGTNTHAQVDTHLGASAPHAGHEVAANKDAANGYAGLNASSRTTKGVDTTDDVIVDAATKGLVLKDTQGTPHYWRVTVNTSGALVISDVGTSKP